MIKIYKITGYIAIALFACGTVYSIVRAATVINTSSNVYITAQVGGTPPVDPNPTPGGGGGSSSGPTTGTPTTVNFSGMGYPSSKVIILQDGNPAITTAADPNANFSASLTNLIPGSYTFSIYTEDRDGYRSVSYSFPVYVTEGATINVGGIILAPTIDVENAQVRKGDNQAIFGYAVPNSKVNITVNSETEHIVSTKAGSTGAYLYNFDTSVLEYGSHDARSRALIADKTSITTDPAHFKVGTQTIKKEKGACGSLIGDVNCDGKVNLVDFSVLAYWYKKAEVPPANVDLNGDGRITLVDFSIMAYHWTG